ncbi:MAG TPA: hypothetical protein PKK84_03375 [Armatimonadota bacterium]|jgi:undecaprenyl pyrophosphate phosphatase UppP|nr:hypothetical protein [Armatimonadota bacterium]
MGLKGGWFMVGAIVVVALYFIREVFRVMRGQVTLTPRQKVARVLGGALLLAVMLMIAWWPHLTVKTNPVAQLLFLFACLLALLLVILMAIIDLGETARLYAKARKQLGRETLTPEDIERLLRSETRDHPDEVGKGPS